MVVKKKKRGKKQKTTAFTSYNDWAPWTREALCLLFPLICNLDQTDKWHCQGCDGSRDRREVLTPKPRICKVQKDQKFPSTTKRSKVLTVEQLKRTKTTCQRFDDSLFFWMTVSTFCTYCERRGYTCLVCGASASKSGEFGDVQRF